MSWVNDLVSASGLPAGAATLAVAMYGACVAAEKAASPDALKDMGRILKYHGWERSVRPIGDHPTGVQSHVWRATFQLEVHPSIGSGNDNRILDIPDGFIS
jgi:hypothetical protein